VYMRGVVGYIAALILILVVVGMVVVTMSAVRAMNTIRRLPQMMVNAYYVTGGREVDTIITVSQVSGAVATRPQILVLALVLGGTKTVVKIPINGGPVTVRIGGSLCNATATSSRSILYTGASTVINATIVCTPTIPVVKSVVGVVVFDKTSVAFAASSPGGG